MTHVFEGIVIWWNKQEGYGLIADSKGNEYYTDPSVTPLSIKRGDVVEFTPSEVVIATLCANNVKIIKESP
jgi:cold shock CspA family protein